MYLESRETVIQNLRDAGCGEEVIEKFIYYADQGQKDKQLIILETHRKQLLSRVHKEEKKIFCLDYLIYQMGKKNQQEV